MSLARAHVGLNKFKSTLVSGLNCCCVHTVFPVATPHGLSSFAHEHSGAKCGEGGEDRCALCYLSVTLNQSFTTAVDRAFLYVYIYVDIKLYYPTRNLIFMKLLSLYMYKIECITRYLKY